MTDVRQQLLRLTEPIALVPEYGTEVSVAGDGVDLPGQLLEELGHLSQTGMDLVGRLALRAERVESSLHRYLPG